MYPLIEFSLTFHHFIHNSTAALKQKMLKFSKMFVVELKFSDVHPVYTRTESETTVSHGIEKRDSRPVSNFAEDPRYQNRRLKCSARVPRPGRSPKEAVSLRLRPALSRASDRSSSSSGFAHLYSVRLTQLSTCSVGKRGSR